MPGTSMQNAKVLITGASSGIGAATAKRFAADGARLVLVARREKRLGELADTLVESFGAEVTRVVLDVRDRARIQELQDSDAFRQVDVLVNNAGLARDLVPIQSQDMDAFDEMVDTNVKGLLYMTRAVLPDMVTRGHGHVINLGSTAGHYTYAGGAVYAATKHAVVALAEAIRHDVHGTGVRVSSVDPGHVETEFSDVRFRGDVDRAAKVYAGWTPLMPDDVAEVIHWCATRPAHVNIQDVLLTATQQSGLAIHRPDRESEPPRPETTGE